MKKKIGILTMLVTMCLLTSCSQNRDKGMEIEFPEGAIQVYYINNETSTLDAEAYMATATSADKLVEELFGKLKQSASLTHQSAVPESVEMLSYILDGEQLTVYFGESYYDMDSITEVLCRAAVVRTLTQIEGVSGVEIMVNNQALIDATGHTVGLMTSDTFMENMGSEINSYKETELKLYFSNAQGDGLVMVNRKLLYNTNISMEKLIVEQLLKGIVAEESDNVAKVALPENTKLINLYVKDGVCYVNFDENFLNHSVGVEEEVVIYSLVNSLTELPTVTKVQISVNGVSNTVLNGKINLNTMFERNLEYIR